MGHPVRPEESIEALKARAAELREGPAEILRLLVAETREVAAGVKALALRRGHSIQIRVKQTESGVRLTLIGPQAVRYRQFIEAELQRRKNTIVRDYRFQPRRKA